MDIYNIAIIAHVDHGKTTLVDAMLKQTHTFRDNQKEMQQTLIMDSNDLEREKGITILSKNTAVYYQDHKINIIDTPGHADFGSEVERVLNMASGALLLVDAVEGPLPQTRFVLKKALEAKLKIILVINKIDKKDARPEEVLNEVENLFLELAPTSDSLDFTVLYGVGRDGKVFLQKPESYSSATEGNLKPLFDTIIKEISNSAVNEDKPFQMLISTLDYDNFVGRLCIGKIHQGILKKGMKVSVVNKDGVLGNFYVTKVYTSFGLIRQEVEEARSGDIIALAGINILEIGQTVTDAEFPISLPVIEVTDPTIKVTIGPNTSPFGGREGEFTTSRQIRERLLHEKQINVGLKIEEEENGNRFIVSGRGELHLAILIETMRREGYEMEVSRPQVVYKEINGEVCEPYEEVSVLVVKEYVGAVTEEFGKRKGILLTMKPDRNEMFNIVYKISSQNLIGLQSVLLTATKGTITINSYLLGYEKRGDNLPSLRSGALISYESGITVIYGLVNAQERGNLFIGPGEEVYAGMVIGINPRPQDMEINVCKEKKLTNNRSKGEGIKRILQPFTVLSLEQALDFIVDDELLEVTPKHIRIRKRILDPNMRKRSHYIPS